MAHDQLTGTTLSGKYEIGELLGSGAFGAVYQAVQRPVGRQVAVKVMGRKHRASEKLRARFFREAQVVAQLRHEAAVTLFDYGEAEDDLLYMVMEFVRGRELSRVLAAEGPFSPKRVLGIAEQVLGVLAEAHDARLVHRDLKPDNIMLFADSDSRERVKVLDFGIAKVLESEEAPAPAADVLTTEAVILGTPAYMSPEQIRAQPVGPGADLYAMGIMLHEMLTGARPFAQHTGYDLLFAHCNAPPPPLPAGLPPALGEVITRALAKTPEARFPSARAMLAALRTSVAGASDGVLGGPINPDAATMTLDSGGAHLASDAFSLDETLAPEESARLAAAVQSGKAGLDAPPAEPPADADVLTWKAPQPRRRLAWLALPAALLIGLLVWRLWPAPAPTEERAVIWRLAPSALPLGRAVVLASGPVTLALSPDGRLLATRAENGRVDIWDPASGGWMGAQSLARPQNTGLAWTPDWRMHAMAGPAKEGYGVKVGQPGTEGVQLTGQNFPIERVALSPDGQWVASSSERSRVKVWGTETESPAVLSFKPDSDVTALAWSAIGAQLLIGTKSGQVWHWMPVGAATPNEVFKLDGPVKALGMTRGGVFVAQNAKDEVTVVGRDGAPRPLASPGPFTAWTTDASGARLLTGDATGQVVLWDLDNGAELRRLPGSGKPITAVALLGPLAVFGDETGTTRAWSLDSGRVRAHHPHGRRVNQVLIDPAGVWYATASEDWTAAIVAIGDDALDATPGPRLVEREGELLWLTDPAADPRTLGDWPPDAETLAALDAALGQFEAIVVSFGADRPLREVRPLLTALRAHGLTGVQALVEGARRHRPVALRLRAPGEPELPAGEGFFQRLRLHARPYEGRTHVLGEVETTSRTFRLQGSKGCSLFDLSPEFGVTELRRVVARGLSALYGHDAEGFLKGHRAAQGVLRADDQVPWRELVALASATHSFGADQITLELSAPALDQMDCDGAMTLRSFASAMGARAVAAE
ncbi:MAG: protein kinase [Myxococcales bacterium]|nr:protein kinase [Myxococcales bacterium]